MRDLAKPSATAPHLFDRLANRLSQNGLVDIKLFAVGAPTLSGDQLAADLLAALDNIDAGRFTVAHLDEAGRDTGDTG